MDADLYPEFRLEDREAFVRDPQQLAHKWTMLPFEATQDLTVELSNADDYEVDFRHFSLSQDSFYQKPETGNQINDKLIKLASGKRGRRFRVAGLTEEGCYCIAARRRQSDRWPKCTFTVVVLKARELNTRFFIVAPPSAKPDAGGPAQPATGAPLPFKGATSLDAALRMANQDVLQPYCNVKIVARPSATAMSMQLSGELPDPLPKASIGPGQPGWLSELEAEAKKGNSSGAPYSVFFVGNIEGGVAGHTWGSRLTIIDRSKQPAGLILAHEAAHFLNSMATQDKLAAMGMDTDGATHISSNGWLMYFESSGSGKKISILHAINMNRDAARLSGALSP